MHNDLYPDMVIGCLKARTVPVNVNHHYTPREVAELLDYVRPRAVIYHRSLGREVRRRAAAGTGADLLISVDDGSDAPGTARARSRLDDALAQGDADAESRRVAGRPDHDLHRRHDRAAQGRAVAAERHLRVVDGGRRPRVRRPRSTTRCADGGRAVVRGFAADACGRHVDGVRGDHARTAGGPLRRPATNSTRARCGETAEREKVGMMTMVGDAYAAPLVEELQRGRLRSVVAVRHRNGRCRNQSEIPARAAGIAAPAHDHQRLRLVGDRQHGVRAQPARHRTATPSTCARADWSLSDDYSRFLEPGEHGGRLGGARRAGFRSATSTMPTPPARPSPWSTASGW